MQVAMFDSHKYDRAAFEAANVDFGHSLHFFEPRLTEATAKLAVGFPAVCAFVNDSLTKSTLQILHEGGVKMIGLRSSGYNHVDLSAAKHLGIKIARVPEYSPHAVAEHTVALILALNRKLHRADGHLLPIECRCAR